MYITIMCSVKNHEEAEKISKILIYENLAACIQAMPIQSSYKWQGKIEKSDELLLLIKTKQDKYKQIEELIKQNHSYEVPEILSLPVDNIFTPYANWIDESVK